MTDIPKIETAQDYFNMTDEQKSQSIKLEDAGLDDKKVTDIQTAIMLAFVIAGGASAAFKAMPLHMLRIGANTIAEEVIGDLDFNDVQFAIACLFLARAGKISQPEGPGKIITVDEGAFQEFKKIWDEDCREE